MSQERIDLHYTKSTIGDPEGTVGPGTTQATEDKDTAIDNKKGIANDNKKVGTDAASCSCCR